MSALTRLLAELLRRIFPKSDPATLYISIDELPNPRGWGSLDFAVGEQLVFSTDGGPPPTTTTLNANPKPVGFFS